MTLDMHASVLYSYSFFEYRTGDRDKILNMLYTIALPKNKTYIYILYIKFTISFVS
jgi:hypothetical protein